MIQRIRQRVESYLLETDRAGIDAYRFFCLDDSKGPVRGCFLLVFGRHSDRPLLIAKGAPRHRARMREGKPVYEIDFENLQTLERIGMNADGPTTPAPLRLWSDDDAIFALQSALDGRLLKNVPGRRLFSADSLPAISDAVLSWWRRLQQRFGVDPRRVTEQLYADQILGPVDLFKSRFVLEADERRFLDRRFSEERRLLGAELPFMATHGDFCTANVMERSGRVAVFDWEFPLRHHLPLFDIFHFFSSTRFPFKGLRGESSHFESFKTVFWGKSYFNDVVRGAVRGICDEYRIPRECVSDLFALSLIHIANLKFDGLVEVYGIDERRPPEQLPSLWQTLGGADKDVPFACIREGRCETLRYLVRTGFPRWLEGGS